MPEHREPDDETTGVPIAELAAHRIEPDPEMPGRVRRSINRNVLAADSLEFSFTGLTDTAWNYLKVAMDLFFGRGADTRPADDATPDNPTPDKKER